MIFKPTAFSIPSTTELKLTFSENVSSSLSKGNFYIESLSGNSNDLEITGIEISNDVIIIKTKPQISGNYYLLKLLDTDESTFKSDRSIRLLGSDSTRQLFFVGIDSINPIRDRIYSLVPNIFDLEKNSLVKKILSVHAEELFSSQNDIGQALSDNYISVKVQDERRIRTSSSTDRLSNEGAYLIDRISENESSSNSINETISFSLNSGVDRESEVPSHPVSLKRAIVKDEVISEYSENNGFKGYLISFKNKNILKLLSLKVVTGEDTEDCNGDIGTFYNIEQFKYAILNNKYDPMYSYSHSELESNQVLLSEFSNIKRPKVGDKITASYVYKDLGKYIVEDTIDVYKIVKEDSESLPSNISNFFLNNAPIVNESNEIFEIGGVSFYNSENNKETPSEFKIEVKFDSAKLPNEPGEYSINYKTGEVYVVGANEDKLGTGDNNYIADYLYRHSFINNLDYSIDNNDFVVNDRRYLAGDEASIQFKYDKVYAEGQDYKVLSHVESINEPVENNIVTSFSIKPKNTPVTDVFRIFNQTTGEIYSLLYHTDTEVFFSGNRSPELVNNYSENSKFKKIINENLSVVGEFISPSFSSQIVSNSSNNSIIFEPGIPSEFIDKNSLDYYIRIIDESSNVVSVEDVNIKFFGDEDSNGIINSLGIISSYTAPSVGSNIIIGTKCYSINLENKSILNKDLDSIGSSINSSIIFDNESIFKKEKFFKPISSTIGFSETNKGGISSAIQESKNDSLYSNLSRLRKPGDYSIDYSNGVIYISVEKDENTDLGMATYSCNSHVVDNKNIIGVGSVVKKMSSSDSIEYATKNYENISFGVNEILINDLEHSTHLFESGDEYANLSGQLSQACEVLNDYTVVVPTIVSSVKSINKTTDLFGSNLSDLNKDIRQQEYSSLELTTPYNMNGKNIYSAEKNIFSGNVIDLKSHQDKIIKKKDRKLVLNIKDTNIGSFYDVVSVKNNEILFDSKLNLIKHKEVSVMQTSLLSSSRMIVYLHPDFAINNISINDNFILDNDENRFKIVDASISNSTITVEIPSENRPSISAISLSDDDTISIITKPSIILSNNSISIEMEDVIGVSPGDIIRVRYLSNYIPSIGTPLSVDYRSGKIYFDYNNIKDELFISYEYGDNSIDWSIGSSINEGDEYFVTYKYGALRSALRRNFGSLTKIPFFESFPLAVDRELYRSALEGTLQAFAKGPTIPAFEGLVKSFTDINPTIDEMAFGNWILGRDYLNPGKVSYSGDLNFYDGKFDDGLYISDDNSVCIPRGSNINLQEGTLEAWVRPEWSGISNDATLTFNIDNIGYKVFSFKGGEDPFDQKNNFDINLSKDPIGSIDSTGSSTTISNYRTVIDEDSHSIVPNSIAITKNEEMLSVTSAFSMTINCSVALSAKNWSHIDNVVTEKNIPVYSRQYIYGRLIEGGSNLVYGLESDYTDSEYINDLSPAFILVDDCNKSVFIPFYYSTLIDYDNGDAIQYNVLEDTLDFEDFENFQRPHQTRMCSCNITDDITKLENFNNMTIRIELSSELNLSQFKTYNNIISDNPGVISVLDANENIFEVIALENNNGIIFYDTIPVNVHAVHVKRKVNNVSYTYNEELEEYDVSKILEHELPSEAITFLYKNIEIVTKSEDNSSMIRFGTKVKNILDWSNELNIKINKKLSSNTLNVDVNGSRISLYYSNLIDSETLFSEINIKNPTSLANSISIGSLENGGISSFDITKVEYNINSRFSEKDVYIGSSGMNPVPLGLASGAIKFSLNKDDYPDSPLGVPFNVGKNKGIFIGYDDTCESPFSKDGVEDGQWFLRADVDEIIKVPSHVDVVAKNIKDGLVKKRDGDEEYYVYVDNNGSILPIPEYLFAFRDAGFNAYQNIFGIHVFSKISSSGASPSNNVISSVDIDDINHITNVLSMYLDNNKDGIPDNMKVIEEMTSRSSFIVILKNPKEFEKLNKKIINNAGYTRINPIFTNKISKNYVKSYKKNGIVTTSGSDFDYTLEDILKFIIREGYSKAYPKIFGNVNSEVQELLNDAKTGRGGAVDPWYRPVSGIAGNENREIIDYVYWSLTSKLGAQEPRCDRLTATVETVVGTDRREIVVSPEETIVTTTERLETSGRPAKLFGAYAWTAFDGTVPVGKYREDPVAVVKILQDLGCNLYARSANEGITPSIDAVGKAYYNGTKISTMKDEDGDGVAETLFEATFRDVSDAFNFEVSYDMSGGYGPDKSAWDEFIKLLDATKGTGIKIYASTGEKHHLKKPTLSAAVPGSPRTWTIYPDRWGMHAQSSPSESTDSMILRMRELATMTLPVEDGGMGYDHLIGLLHDDTSNSIGQGLWEPGDYEHGYTPSQILSITNAARDINPNFEFIPTMYYQKFGALLAKDGIELGQKTRVDGAQRGLRPGATPYGTERGPEGSSAYYTFEKPEGDGPIYLSFAYQSIWKASVVKELTPTTPDETIAGLRSLAQNVHTECFINGNRIFSRDLDRENIISFFDSEDLSPYIEDGDNQIEIRLWNKSSTEVSGNIAKIAWFWNFELTSGGVSITDKLSDPSFFIADKDFSQGYISVPKMYARSNSVKAVHSSLTSISPVYPKNLTGVPEDHERSRYVRVIEMLKKNMPDVNFIEQERAYAWGSPIDPDIFDMKIDEASKIADGVLIYNLPVETLRQAENDGVFQEPETDSELNYSKIAWTPANYAPKNGYFREWTTREALSGDITFEIFLPALAGGGGLYGFYLYDDSGSLLYSGNNGSADFASSKRALGYGFAAGNKDDYGVVQPVFLSLSSPTKIRFLWKVKGTYGSVYNYLKFRIALGKMSDEYLGRQRPYDEDSPTYVYDDFGTKLDLYPRDSYDYNAGIDEENEAIYSYKEIIDRMSNLYKNVLTDRTVIDEVVEVIGAVTVVEESDIIEVVQVGTWNLCTKNLVKEKDPEAFSMYSKKNLALPSKTPNGKYNAKNKIIKIDVEEAENSLIPKIVSIRTDSGEYFEAIYIHPNPGTKTSAIIYNHSETVTRLGYGPSKRHGYDLDSIAKSIADSKNACLIPIRTKAYGSHGSRIWAASGGIVEAAFKFLQTKSDINEDAISLIGLSDGAIISMYAASKEIKKDLLSLVLISPNFKSLHKDKVWKSFGDLEKYFKNLGIDLDFLSRPSSPRLPVVITTSIGDDEYVIRNSSEIFLTYYRDKLSGKIIIKDGYMGDSSMFNSLSGDYWEDILRILSVEEAIVDTENPLDLYKFTTKYDNIYASYKVSGTIQTDGEFSSVSRTLRMIDSLDCYSDNICEKKFRYNGNTALHKDGWSYIHDSQSDLVNVLGAGSESMHSEWKLFGPTLGKASGGIYRMLKRLSSDGLIKDADPQKYGMFVSTRNPCSSGNTDLLVSLRVLDVSESIPFGSTGVFSGAVSGNMTGIAPIHFCNELFNVKLSLAISNSNEAIILIIDGESNSIIDIASFNWKDNGFHDYKIILDSDLEILTVYADNKVISRILYSDFKVPEFKNENETEPFISIHLFDARLVDYNLFHKENSPSVIDIDHILFTSKESKATSKSFDNDMMISDDHKVDFSFGENISCKFGIEHVDGYEGYESYDGYSTVFGTIPVRLGSKYVKLPGSLGPLQSKIVSMPIDGYSDGYSEEFVVQPVVNEILMSSDKLRYIVDMGDSDFKNRMSIFKDGKGFLNFRILEESDDNIYELYNIATNIKHFNKKESHHIAASWKLNSFDERDSIRLFLDGLEVPNMFKFGGKAPVLINSKFSDVGKEVLHDFQTSKVSFYKDLSDGTVSANSSLFYSDSAEFKDSMIGRSIIVKSANTATDMVGKSYVIGSVNGNSVSFLDPESMNVVTFTASDSSISFCFAPSSGVERKIVTDLKNSKFAIFRKGSDGSIEEMGGVLYSTKNGAVEIIKSDNVINPKYRANIDTGYIDFVGKDQDDCKYKETASYSDLEVHIETFGLTSRRCNKIINITSSTLEDNVVYDIPSKKISILKTREAEPSDLSSVMIKRILMKRTAILNGSNSKYSKDEDKTVCKFSININGTNFTKKPKINSNPIYFVTSKGLGVNDENLGRAISIDFESDNIDYSDSNKQNHITVFGRTVYGNENEIIYINKNAKYSTKKYFTEVYGVQGELVVLDDDYDESAVISIEEADDIFTENNGGDKAEIFKYINGEFIISSAGKNGTVPFVLNPGLYKIDYISNLRIRIPTAGEKLYIGCDINEKNNLNAVIDEFRIISEMSSDTRPTEVYSYGTRSITEDYNKKVPFCLDKQTLALIHFDNPVEKQSRVLRRKEFLNEETNNKYRLDSKTREVLIKYINSSRDFISKMINMGYSKDIATQTFYESHLAGGGPISNEADFYSSFDELYYSSSSVNSSFGKSGRFVEGSSLLYNNRNGIFRKNEGTIEFWVSPMLDFDNDMEERKYVDIYSAARTRVSSTSSTIVNLPSSAKSIVEVRLLGKEAEFSKFYTEGEVDKILFDNVYRNEITGRLSGGTGVSKDFSVGHTISADGKTVFLKEALPSENVDVLVTYIPSESNGDRLSIYKSKGGSISFMIRANGIENIVTKDVNWKKNTWHRVCCTYRTNSSFDTMKLFVDGVEGGKIKYGESIKYGGGKVYGLVTSDDDGIRDVEYKITLKDEFRLIAIGSSIFGDDFSRSRIDNMRFSRVSRKMLRNASGDYIDSNYSKNLNTISPVVFDDDSTFILDFNEEPTLNESLVSVIDPKNGIFDFDINVIDNFNKVIGINNGEIEDVIVELVNRLKPAHSNALVKFTDKHC